MVSGVEIKYSQRSKQARFLVSRLHHLILHSQLRRTHLCSNVSLLAGLLFLKQTGSLEDLPLGDTLAIARIQDCISSSVSPWVMTEKFKTNNRDAGAFLEMSIPLQELMPFPILQGRGILKSKVLKGEYEALGSLL